MRLRKHDVITSIRLPKEVDNKIPSGLLIKNTPISRQYAQRRITKVSCPEPRVFHRRVYLCKLTPPVIRNGIKVLLGILAKITSVVMFLLILNALGASTEGT